MESAVSITNQPVVIDNGSGVVKAGFAGDDKPSCVFQSLVGRPKHVRVMAGALEGDFFVGKKAQEHRGMLRIRYPMEKGIVTQWADMEKIWAHVFSKEQLNIPMDEHPVLLTEAPLNPRRNREKAAEVFFETFNVPSLFVSPQATLSLYASGRTTGIVLDSGDGVTHAVPVYAGFALPHAITRIDVAGRDVTDHLMLLLRKAGVSFHTSAEREIVRSIKEKTCFVAFNPSKEEELEREQRTAPIPYKLPDGNTIQLGPERFRAPELLFTPGLIGSEYPGIHETLMQSIYKSDLDLRSSFFSNIVLAGGSTMFSGFGDRLLNEMRRLSPKDCKVRIFAPPDRTVSTWAGGSILASLASFKSMWVRKDEYEESGASIMHKKTL